MTVYTVHEAPDPPANRIDRAVDLKFVKDGFSWGAALVPPVWLAVRGEWLALAAYLALVTIIALPAATLGTDASWPLLIIAAIHILAGFEAGEFERWSLERQGWREIATVSGTSRADCERRFFDDWLPRDASSAGDVARDPSAASAPVARRSTSFDWRSLFGLNS